MSCLFEYNIPMYMWHGYKALIGVKEGGGAGKGDHLKEKKDEGRGVRVWISG